MAIYHFSAKVIGRGAGRSAVAAAAYRAAERLHDERLGRDHDFTAKAGVVHSEILTPEGAPERWRDRATLWNEVEATERRKDAQLARDVEVALPRELSRAEAVALARDFVRQEFVSRDMVADLNVHWGVGRDGEAQPHAHVMLTMRRVEGDGFGPKARDWNSTELLQGWRERWADMANQRLHELGHNARIDHRSFAAQGIALEPQGKVGPAGERRAERGEDAERRAEHDAIARRNGERIAADPALALDALTRQQSTFTRQDLARFVSRYTDGAEQFASVMAKVEAAPELVRLGQDGRGRERFTTREMLAAERQMEEAGAALAHSPAHRVERVVAERALRSAEVRGLRLGAEQRDALRHVAEGGDLALVVGYAGTGKSAMLGVAREAWEGAGYRVRGAALSGIAAEGLEAGSGIKSRTLASLKWGWREGREGDRLTSRDVLVVDEAGMVGSRQMERVLSHAREAGAKVVLVGDPEQLQAIEAGAAFRALAERHGAAELGEVRRQREGWQRDATRELATGRTADALLRYERAGGVRGHGSEEEARAAVVAGWAAERRDDPHASRVMLAHTRADVAELNRLAREAMRGAGQLGTEHQVQTEAGPRAMAAGDRVMFLRNERGLGAGPGGCSGAAVKNGTLGTVLAVEAGGERLTVALDGVGGAARQGPAVTFYLRDYAHLDHGYAATVHKAQGVTVSRAHVLAGAGMDRHSAYVALTRHREGVQLHWSAEAMGDREGLARTLSRARPKDTSLDYDGPGQVAAFAERRGLAPAGDIAVRTPGGEGGRRVRTEPAREAPPAPLLPALRDPWGRDSLGRAATLGDLRAAADADPRVRRAEEDRAHWIASAYRDPEAARARLDAVLAAEGGDLQRAAARLREAGPEALGRLNGREGWFAGQEAAWRRMNARGAAHSVVRSLEDEAGHRERAAEAWRDAVEAQRGRDAVEVPGLSPAAWRALEDVARARAEADRRARPGEGWHAAEARRDARVALAWERGRRAGVVEEIGRFLEAARARLGEEGVRGALRAASRGGAAEVPGAKREQARDLARLARGVSLAEEGAERHRSHGWRVQERQRERKAEVAAEKARSAERQRHGLPPLSTKEQRREREQHRQRQGPRLSM
ncbi:Ti-type conjugative transfer relaxase TraA [Roseomonas sp. NAR14]|uniref:Ti-type conjugative transfer relaxase TraA n=1 Tax=Roseomonas acroporae TaxID=2937791 RepID=A0A9X1YCF6_9PROT|nr:Ti-type conjugative transfer relaxase TraA [Roseomonas acroporae]